MLLRKEVINNKILGIWKIEETKEQLLSCLANHSFLEKDILSLTSELKISERLAVRILLKNMLGSEPEIAYYESGKPYLKGSELNISISHTRGYVAAITGTEEYIGIDIQYFTEKIRKIKERFISHHEYIKSSNDLVHLLLHWSAKESLYKAVGSGINLKESFFIYPFIPEEKGTLKAVEKITGRNNKFDIYYEVTPEYVLTYID